jgi:hypothetical protein
MNQNTENNKIQEGQIIPNNLPKETTQDQNKTLASPRTLLTETWETYQNNLETFLIIMAIPLVIGQLPKLISALAGGPEGTSIWNQVFTGGVLLLPALAILAAVLSLIAQPLATLAILTVLSEKQTGVDPKQAYKKAFKKILPYIGLTVLSSLIITSGTLLLLIPGIILAIWFSFDIPILVEENLKGFNALLKSREYVRDVWWPVLGRLLYTTGAMIVVAIISSMFFDTLAGVTFPAIKQAKSLVNNLFIRPIALIYTFKLYQEAKRIKGEIPFNPTTKDKLPYIGLIVLGVLISLGSLGFVGWILYEYVALQL